MFNNQIDRGKRYFANLQKLFAFPSRSCFSRFAMLEKVQKLLENQSLMDLSVKTNIPYCWLNRVKNGTVKSPNLKRLEFLYDYLIALQ